MIKEIKQCLVKERNLLSYLHLLKKVIARYLIIITVADTGAEDYFSAECSKAMMDLGLKVDMLRRFRQPYIAIIDRGNILAEQVSENTEVPLNLSGRMNDHVFEVYSAGFNCRHGIGCGAMVLVDGANYLVSDNSRGFNFFVYDESRDEIVDVCVFDTFDMGQCRHGNNPLSQAYLSFQKKYSSIQLCTFSFPRFPSKYNLDISPWGKFMIENNVDIANLVNTRQKRETIWKEQLFPFCHDYASEKDFLEVFHTPDSIISMDGHRRFLDYESHTVNTNNGVRVTLYQPSIVKR